MRVTKERFFQILDSIVPNFLKTASKVADKLTESYVQQIEEVDAIDRRWYIESVAKHLLEETGTGVKFVIDNREDERVGYAGFVEFPSNQASGEHRAGRYPALRGITSYEPRPEFTQAMDNTFVV